MSLTEGVNRRETVPLAPGGPVSHTPAMQRHRALSLTVAVLFTGLPTVALACDFAIPADPAGREAAARATIDQFAAIIDAEVVRAPAPGRPALVRAVRVFKGPRLEMFEIGPQRTSCDAGIGGVGSRQRLFLTGGPDLWYAGDTASYPADEDRLLGSDREQDWPFVGVAIQP
ncbi:hypothetical protein [Brevundimonas sp.]|uniref:hypothetical protein n=1 Tax=Brevundimonas sp. TaxID=1871086 RepID=UPI0025C3CAFF|nr:hypothetical protein [Brevundimonas sp.]